ncbi:MAG: hypothetical protein ACE5HO_13700 [bacterium]
MISRTYFLIQFTILLLFQNLPAQTNLSIGQRFAVIIGGIGGQQAFTDKYYGQTSRMYDILVDSLHYPRENVYFLFEDPSYDSLNINYKATAVNVAKVFGKLRKTMQAGDQLFLFLVGHGTFDGNWSKFNLVGPDLRDIDFARLVDQLPTQKIIVVNTASASGPFVKKMSGKQRIIITATKNGYENYETTFADFFIDATLKKEADVNKDHHISMLEAFNYAKVGQDAWFVEKRRLRPEHPLLDDNGDGVGVQTVRNRGDGQLARTVYLEPVAPDLKASLRRIKAGTQSPLDSLKLKRFQLSQEIERLKAQKEQMPSKEYSKKLETLLIQLARVNKRIRETTSGNQP